MNPSLRRWAGRGLRVLFGVAGLVFLGIAFQQTWVRSQQHVIPSAWHIAGAGALILSGLFCASRSWAVLFGGMASVRELARGFFTSQLGKYVPGGIWQAMGQVGLASRAGVRVSEASAAFLVQAVTQVAAGATVGASLVALGTHLSWGARLLSLLVLLLLPPLHRAWMVRAVRFFQRIMRRDPSEDIVPSQDRILRSYGWSVLTVVASGSAFALLASSVHASSPPIAAVPAFALAWTVGFLAVPFPSGLGIREAVLIGTLGSAFGTAPVIAASVVHRLVTMVGELVMNVAVRVRSRRVPDDA